MRCNLNKGYTICIWWPSSSSSDNHGLYRVHPSLFLWEGFEYRCKENTGGMWVFEMGSIGLSNRIQSPC